MVRHWADVVVPIDEYGSVASPGNGAARQLVVTGAALA